MFTSSPAVWLVSLTSFFACTAGAQTAATAKVSPALPEPLAYSSAMEGYKSFSDEKATPWKSANDTVNSRGGWRAYAKEASGEPSASGGPAVADPHAGHAMPAAKAKP